MRKCLVKKHDASSEEATESGVLEEDQRKRPRMRLEEMQMELDNVTCMMFEQYIEQGSGFLLR